MWRCFYAATFVLLTLALVFIQRVHILTRWPLSFLAHCKFGCRRTMDARIEWLRFIVRV